MMDGRRSGHLPMKEGAAAAVERGNVDTRLVPRAADGFAPTVIVPCACPSFQSANGQALG